MSINIRGLSLTDILGEGLMRICIYGLLSSEISGQA